MREVLGGKRHHGFLLERLHEGIAQAMEPKPLGSGRRLADLFHAEREIPFMKGYTVFNIEQIEGLPAHYYAQPVNPLPLSARIENADRFMTNTAATIHHGGNRAFYAPARDAIQLPPFEAFKEKESYYATALHELTHWTKHERRLERDFSAKRFGDDGYAREELVAELVESGTAVAIVGCS